MTDFFYIIGIGIVAILAFHTFTMKKELIVKEHKEVSEMLGNPHESYLFFKKNISRFILSALIWAYIIIGIISSEQKFFFSTILFFIIGSSYAPLFTKDNKNKYIAEMATHIIATILLAIVIYRNFYILTS